MKKIPLTQGKFALVDDSDFDELIRYRWFLRKSNGKIYAAGRHETISKKVYRKVLMHHNIIGKPQRGKVVDHIDGNPLNNCRSNLRVCTQQQNTMNRTVQSNNTLSGFKGVNVQKHKSGTYYQARIWVNKKVVHLGSFKTVIDAAKAYNKAALEYFGEYARLNVLP